MPLYTDDVEKDLIAQLNQNRLTRLDLSPFWVSGKMLRSLEGHSSSVSSVAVLPNGQVVSASGDNTLKVWNPETGECLRTLRGHSKSVSCLAVLPNGQVVSASHAEKVFWSPECCTLKVWNPNTGECLKTLTEHSKSVSCLAVLPNGQVVGGSDRNLSVAVTETLRSGTRTPASALKPSRSIQKAYPVLLSYRMGRSSVAVTMGR